MSKLVPVTQKKLLSRPLNSKVASGERRDCFVFAIASAAEISYEQAHELVSEKFGRKSKKGTPTGAILKGLTVGTSLGSRRVVEVMERPVSTYKLYGELVPRMKRLRNFVKEHPTGTYLILIRGHALTLKDGVVYDNVTNTSETCLVKHAFKIE